jgi:hypothetical protein
MFYALPLCLLLSCAAAQMYITFEGLDQPQQHKLQQRLAAVEAWYSSGKEIGPAISTMRQLLAERQLPAPKDLNHFIHYQIEKLTSYYTLLDVREHPCPPKVPNEVIQRAADILAHGYEYALISQFGPYLNYFRETRHFTSMRQACMLSAELRGIMQQYDVTPKYILKRIHIVAPRLAYTGLPMKIQLSAENMQQRMEYAAWMYAQHVADPKFLQKILWGDETRIYMGKDLLGRLRVYHYTGHYEGQPPIPNPLLNKENSMRVDVALFVDAVNGLAFVEFLTGTTNIEAEGRYTVGMRTAWFSRLLAGLGPYKVSEKKIQHPATPSRMYCGLPNRSRSTSV